MALDEGWVWMTSLLAAAGLTLAALWSIPAGAQQPAADASVEPFTVRNVMVDRTGATAAATRGRSRGDEGAED